MNTDIFLLTQRLSIIIFGLSSLVSCDAEQPTSTAKPPSHHRAAAPHLVETSLVKRHTTETQQHFTGTVKAQHRVRIFNQEEGRIELLSVDIGDKVSQDQVLFKTNPQLLKAEMAKAKANYNKASADLKRIAEMHKQKLASDLEKIQADTAMGVAIAEKNILKLRIKNTTIKAPFNGIVLERLVEQGNVIPKFTHALTLIDPQKLWLRLPVSEMLLPYIKPGGQPTIETLNSRQAISGVVVKTLPQIDQTTKQGLVEIHLQAQQPTLMVGQSVSVTLNIPSLSKLTIPFIALQRDHDSEYVFTFNEGTAIKTKVTSGRYIGNQVEILTGLTENQAVITKGFVGLKNDTKVTLLQ
ncbi:MAG: efflux RND transporter periplasmic adaptor subunit [Methylococcales bacterium]|nr:efflux RND transporter periplasmic adaptor subunit [Methylococcales bacterium]